MLNEYWSYTAQTNIQSIQSVQFHIAGWIATQFFNEVILYYFLQSGHDTLLLLDMGKLYEVKQVWIVQH